MIRGRFAPTPSGRMHLGNILSFLIAWLSAKSQGGEIVLRMEDLDTQRTKPEYAEWIIADLTWFSLFWDQRCPDQSTRTSAYDNALEKLFLLNRIYPCYCTRGQLHAASAPHASDGRTIYPGTCRSLTAEQRKKIKRPPCLRVLVPDQTIQVKDRLQGPFSLNLASEWGDFIVRRADGVYAYQLAVTVDDAAAKVTEVVRGSDLLSSSVPQAWLCMVLGYEVPMYAHVPMLLAPDGRRLSKRDRDLDIGVLRNVHSAEELLGFLAWKCGLLNRREAISATELLSVFSWEKMRRQDIRLSEDDRKWLSGT